MTKLGKIKTLTIASLSHQSLLRNQPLQRKTHHKPPSAMAGMAKAGAIKDAKAEAGVANVAIAWVA